MQVCVIGTGYVGLVTGVCLAHIGHRVICVDTNVEKVNGLRQGIPPIYEPGLEALMATAMEDQRLSFTTELGEAVLSAEILFIAVGTPSLPTGESDTRYVEAVARGIGEQFAILTAQGDRNYRVIVNKSTVPIGSGDWVRSLILSELKQRGMGEDLLFDVVSNPEFLREGSAIYDTFNPDRIVLGGNSPRAIARMKTLYRPILDGGTSTESESRPVPLVVTDLSSAEMIKYAANAFLATKISFINEVANICDRVGADVTQVARGIGLDQRIGPRFLQAGLGWGGSCFPKDVAALVHTARDYGYQPTLLQASVGVNQAQRWLAIEKLQQHLKILKGKTIGLLGLTFKPDTDDLREAPALSLIEQLHRLGAGVKAYDPLLSEIQHPPDLGMAALAPTPEILAEDADALVLVTDWPQFQSLDYEQLGALMRTRVLLDGRNSLDPDRLAQAGFTVISFGRPLHHPQLRSPLPPPPLPMATRTTAA